MVALPDFHRDFNDAPHSFAEPTELPEQDTLWLDAWRAIRVLCGTSLLAATFGLWLVPTGMGDPGMMLIKLALSLGLFWAGVLCMSQAVPGTDLPQIEIDTRARRLRVSHAQAGSPVSVYDLDDLTELSLRDRMLTARDREGRQIVTLALQDARTERTLRHALSLAA